MNTRLLLLRTCTASLLVAGTCIGGGMLALPLASAPGGFVPSVTYMALVWLAMTATGLCLVEIGLWMKKEDVHLVTMASTILGKPGKWLVWLLFAFISYASLAAYTGGCANLIAKGITALFSISISKGASATLFVLLATPFLLGPRRFLGRANDIVFIAMIIAYFVIVSQGFDLIETENIFRADWQKAPMAIPLLLTAFSCHLMIPSLKSFLDNHAKALRAAVIFGMTIAFLVYALWQLVIFGSVPLEGHNGLSQALILDEPATYCLEQLTHSSIIPKAASLFALFALITSFFGIGMGLFDFLADGLHIPRKGKGALLLAALVLLPSLFFAAYFERIFITALDITGGFGDTLISGMIPILMLIIGSKTIAPKKIRWSFFHYILLFVLFTAFVSAFLYETKIRFISGESVEIHQVEQQ